MAWLTPDLCKIATYVTVTGPYMRHGAVTKVLPALHHLTGLWSIWRRLSFLGACLQSPHLQLAASVPLILCSAMVVVMRNWVLGF